MRFQVFFNLLCVLILCFSIFSVEGRKHPRRMSKFYKGKSCCPPIAGSVPRTQKGNIMKNCKPCKWKPKSQSWVVPGALPQV